MWGEQEDAGGGKKMSRRVLRLLESGGGGGGEDCEGKTLRETTAFLVNISSNFCRDTEV